MVEPEFAVFSPARPSSVSEAALTHVEGVRARRTAGDLLALAVTRGDDAALGNVNLVFRFAPGSGQAALGYWTTPAARGRGLAVAASRLLCDWGFEELGLTRIELLVHPANVASRRVADKLGAVVDGTASYPTGDGGAREMVRYSLRPPEGVGAA